MIIIEILNNAFPGHRTPIPRAAEWLDVDQSTIYRWIKHPDKVPVMARIAFAYLDLVGPIDPPETTKENEK